MSMKLLEMIAKEGKRKYQIVLVAMIFLTLVKLTTDYSDESYTDAMIWCFGLFIGGNGIERLGSTAETVVASLKKLKGRSDDTDTESTT